MTQTNNQDILKIDFEVEYDTYQPRPLSYFFLRLLDYLNESYPYLAADFDFIANRDELAAIVFQVEKSNGSSHEEAMDKADEVLFRDLHFSLHDMIEEVLDEEYSNVIDAFRSHELAIALYEEIEPLLENYNITPEFEDDEDYDRLYSEVVGKILEIFDHYGI